MEITKPNMETALASFSPADAAIEAMAARFMPLLIDGIEDKVGLKVVHEARMEVRGHRIQVDKTRVALKAESLAWGRTVDSEAKRLTALLAPVEEHLKEQEAIIDREKSRLKAEREAKIKARLDDRMTALSEVRSSLLPSEVSSMTNAEFDTALAGALWLTPSAWKSSGKRPRQSAWPTRRLRTKRRPSGSAWLPNV